MVEYSRFAPMLRVPLITIVISALVAVSVAVISPAAMAHPPVTSTVRPSPDVISPDGDGVADTVRVNVRLARTSYVAATVVRNGKVVRRLRTATMRPGTRSITWDGRVDAGSPAAAGRYAVRVTLRDLSGHWRIVTAQIAVNAPPPAPTAFQWPVSGSVSSPFGPRDGRMHHGIDIPVPAMTPVAAAAAGTVRFAGTMDGYGLVVIIDHPDGTASLYAHEAKLAVATGSAVVAGQVIGYAGRTGTATTEQVHFELYDATRTPVDPVPLLPVVAP